MVDARKYAAGGFIKVDDVKNAPIRERIVHVEVGQYGKLDVTLESSRKLGLNGTSVGALMCEFGTDTDTWPGHEIEIYVGKVKFRGDLKDAVLARPAEGDTWEEVESWKEDVPDSPPPKERDPDDE
jgi:hypothetical protein